MTTTPETLGAGYFDGMYAAAADPWGFEERWYERRKYAIAWPCSPGSGTAPPSSRAAPSACSPGCSPRAAAPCCPATSPRPPSRPRPRGLPDLAQVRVEQRDIPGQWPSGRFDLIVLSEVLYYFGDHDLEQVLKHAAASLEPDGTLLAVHWRHPVAEYPRTGDDVHRALAAQPGLARLAGHVEPDFLAEVYIRTEGTPASVAQATGLV